LIMSLKNFLMLGSWAGYCLFGGRAGDWAVYGICGNGDGYGDGYGYGTGREDGAGYGYGDGDGYQEQDLEKAGATVCG
jgi:hypothetical protein